MSRKNLPRAVMRTALDMREAAAAERPALRPAAASEQSWRRVAAPDLALVHEVIPAARRRSLAARIIVERYATYSALGGFIPLPLVNFSSVAAIIVRMVKVLSDHYGVPFQRARARTIVIGLMGGAAPSGLGTVTASTLSNFVPGGLFIGLAVSSVAATACTRSIGRIFVEHFENGATLADFPAVEKR